MIKALTVLGFFGVAMFFYQSAALAQTAPKSSPDHVHVVESSEEQKLSLREQPDLQFGNSRTSGLTIQINEAVTYQPIQGFGASLTDSSAWLLWNKLPAAQRDETLQQLFDRRKGIGLSILRQPMGASDFALDDYSYDDVPDGDPSLQKFSIEKDQRYIIPILKQALAINPQLKIIATPWSPPGWMKTSHSMIRGALLPDSYRPLANYFVRFVQGYEQAGLPVYAVTMQNEPVNVPVDYPGMDMTAREQAAFLGGYLGPAFRDAKLKTKILIFDHNWNLIQFPIDVLNDSKTAQFADGIATHCYGGTPAAQLELHDRFPDKPIWMTECSGGDWQKGKLLNQQAHLIIESIRNWANSVVFWNLALDQNHEPYFGGCTTCRGVVTIKHDITPPQVIPSVDFTALGHASKFVVPGALRIDSNSFGEGSLEDVAFRNPDGSLVLLVLNSSTQPVTFNLAWHGRFATYTLRADTLATFVWNESAPHNN